MAWRPESDDIVDAPKGGAQPEAKQPETKQQLAAWLGASDADEEAAERHAAVRAVLDSSGKVDNFLSRLAIAEKAPPSRPGSPSVSRPSSPSTPARVPKLALGMLSPLAAPQCR